MINTAYQHLRNTILRGGRMTKWKGLAASMAPMVGAVIAPTLLGGAITISGAGSVSAGTCTETAAGSGNWICSGPAGADTSQLLSNPILLPGSLVATTDPDFGINVALGVAINLFNSANFDDLSFLDDNRSVITGETAGIAAVQWGDGAAIVDVNGNVSATADNGSGIFLDMFSVPNGTDAVIEADGAVYGGGFGIFARHGGSGELSITTDSEVRGVSGDGIYARTSGTDLTVTSNGLVHGGDEGIDVRHTGTGALTVTTFGDVISDTDVGIRAWQFNEASTGPVDIRAYANITAAHRGIAARQEGAGNLIIETGEGVIVEATDVGLYGRIFDAGMGDLTITSGGDIRALEGSDGLKRGITARNTGAGALVVTSEGDIEDAFNVGIYTLSNGTSLNITSNGSVYGGFRAIVARSNGSGAATIAAAGDVNAGTDGIFAIQSANGTSLSITVDGSVTGGRHGILAENFGTAGLRISGSGDVVGEAGDGIQAYNSANDTTGSMYIYRAPGSSTMGANDGIAATNGGGSLTITALGAVEGDTDGDGIGEGIDARNLATATALSITTGDGEISGRVGIHAINEGSGALTITTGAGSVIGETESGIFARNFSDELVSVVTNGDVEGQTSGMNIINEGGGSVSIEVNGEIQGYTNAGINVRNLVGGDTTVLTASSVTGATHGVAVNHQGSGALAVTLGDNTYGGVYGVYNRAASQGGTFTITSTGSLSGGSGVAFLDAADGTNGDPSSALNIEGALNGDAQMGAGSDAITVFSTAALQAGITLDGGDDLLTTDGMVDVLTFDGWTGSFTGANAINWEEVRLAAGTDITFDDGLLIVGDASDAATGLFVEAGGMLSQGGIGLDLTGNLTNAGRVSLQDGATGDMIVVSGSYTGDMGQFLLDVDTGADTADTMTVAGDTSGATGIVVNNLSPLVATGNDILLVSVAGTSAATDFALAGGPVVAGAFQYDLEYRTDSFWLAGMLSSTGAVYEAAPHVLLDGFTRMPTLEQRVGQRRWNSAAGTLEPTSGGWLRIQGDWSEAGLDTGTSYDADSWGLQAGFDLPMERGENGQWVLGLTAQTGRTSAGITTATGTGSMSAESIGFGATATWYGYDDLYVDIQAQVNWAGVDYSSSLHGSLAEDELARTATASVEVGQRFALDASRGLIPQAQLVWSQVDGGSFTDSAGNAVDLGTNERVTGRLGLAYDYEWADAAQGSMQNVYGIVNLLHDFSNSASVEVAGATLSSEREETWGEIGLGGSMTWNDTTTLYGEASYREALGSGSGSGFAATAGLRFQW